jgi:hypothetical protein
MSNKELFDSEKAAIMAQNEWKLITEEEQQILLFELEQKHLAQKVDIADAAEKEITANTRRELTERERLTNDSAREFGEIFGAYLATTEKDAKQFQKLMLSSALTALEKQLQISIAQVFLSETSKYGPAGLVTGAILSGVLTGIVSVAKSKIEGFAGGGIVQGGYPVRRANGDNVLITAKRGEAILNNSQIAAIGAGRLAAAGVPGFANGGLVGADMLRGRNMTETVQTVLVVRDLDDVRQKQMKEVVIQRN